MVPSPRARSTLTFHVQADAPPVVIQTNWLPAPKDVDFSLYLRAYWSMTAITGGSWTPPPVEEVV
nr:DUF1214 domain-containing protein [Nordella sp. HKS 07]